MHILLTGAAGFIGFHAARRLLADGHQVVGIDNLNDHYDPALKRDRLAMLEPVGGFRFEHLDIADADALDRAFSTQSFDRVVHLAARPGVRHSIEHPNQCVQDNLVGFGNVLEACRRHHTPHLVYATSSSVYGALRSVPYTEQAPVDHPVSLYAATKRANELMAHVYASVHGLPTTGLRFFTVYGPWGRPDMALFRFTRALLAGEPIDVFNRGRHQRDFTYVDDIVEGLVRVVASCPSSDSRWDAQAPDPATSNAPFRLYNIGNSRPVGLDRFIEALEQRLGVTAERRNRPLQPGDMEDTWADCSALERDFNYRPSTPLDVGIDRFVTWYLGWSEQGRQA